MLTGIIIFSSIIGALLIYIPYSKTHDQLIQQNRLLQQEKKSLQGKLDDERQKRAEMIKETKQNDEETPQTGGVFYSFTKTPLSKTETQIDVFLKGEKDMMIDATDLVLSHTPTIVIKEIKKGTAFPSYPRSMDLDGRITITGIAIPQGNSFMYGKTNELFVSLIVEKISGDGVITLIEKDTQAYINGAPILDFTRSFKQISL